ncbi:MAG: hypothetical protein J6N49_01435 [Alphaproteobacteria bacterium]|nr:hypothetical protein [Alphaproteobacteria bacterium]
MIKSSNESGRSMIEMLGVLAIIGVLSVGGIAGYSKAMMQYKINKTADQITQIVGNVRTLFASQKSYNITCVNSSDSGCKIIKKAHLAPEEMWNTSGTGLENPFGGDVHLQEGGKKSDSDSKAFSIFIHSLPEEACMAIATYDWGSGSSSGLLAVAVNTQSPGDFRIYDGYCGSSSDGKAIATPNGSTVSIPMPVSVAATACREGENMIGLKFY